MKKKYTKQERKKIIELYSDLRENPDKYGCEVVYIEENGDVRELNADEIKHINTIYGSFDGEMPNYKASYNSTNYGKRSGFLLRSKLPIDIIEKHKERWIQNNKKEKGKDNEKE